MYTYIICIYEKRKINPCFLNSFLFQVWVSYEADYVRAMHLKACLPQRHLSLPPALLRLLCMTMPNCLLFKLYTMLILQISMSMWAKRLKILLDSRINTLLFWRSSYHPWKQGEGKKKIIPLAQVPTRFCTMHEPDSAERESTEFAISLEKVKQNKNWKCQAVAKNEEFYLVWNYKPCNLKWQLVIPFWNSA